MANILLLTLVFPPDSVSTAQIMGDLACDLRLLGHSLTVLTTTPHYNRDLEMESKQSLKKYWGCLLKKSDYHGIPVFHTWMPKKGRSVFLRLLSWALFLFMGTFVGIAAIPKPDIIITPSPPLTIGLSAWIIGRIRRAPFVYNVQEIYPDIAINLGAIRNALLIRSLFFLERFVYKRASRVTVIAAQMRACLLEKQVEPGKVEVIPNFVDLSDFGPLAKDNGFSRKYNLHDKFLISYAGNMGPAQQLEVFVGAANILKNESQIHFLMLGDGILRSELQRQVEDFNLSNFTFLSYQPYSMMPQIYAASDLSLVPLAPQTGSVAVPSKVYRIMACERPILAMADANTDLAKLVLEAKCGAVIAPGSPAALANAIQEASRNSEKWQQCGKNGYAHVIENYSRSSVTNRYNELIEDVLHSMKVPASRC